MKTNHLPRQTLDTHTCQEYSKFMAVRSDDRLPISPMYALARPSGYEYLRDHLGYRLELRSTTMPRTLTIVTGATSVELSLAAALVNWGFAAPISPRPCQLVLMTGRNSSSNTKIIWRSHT